MILASHLKETVVGQTHFFELTDSSGKTIIGTIAIAIRQKSAEIKPLVIWNKENRRSGYGSLLLAKSMGMIKESTGMSLFKVSANKDALDFYTKQGFHLETKLIENNKHQLSTLSLELK